MKSSKRAMRSWVIWTVVGVWSGTAIVIMVLVLIHPPTVANISLTVRQFSFKTNAKTILDRMNEQQLIISGISSLEVHSNQALKVTTNGGRQSGNKSLKLQGRSPSACSFDNVTSSGLELSGLSFITLIWPGTKDSFTIKSHGAFVGNLTSQPNARDVISGFSCTNVDLNGKSIQSIDVDFSSSGGDSVDFSTVTDGRVDFRGNEASQLKDSQIPISEPMRISYIEPGEAPSQEKTVLLKPSSGEKNQIFFESVGKTVTVDNADLILIVPNKNFYLRQFKADGGIVLSLQGVVSDIKMGAGIGDLRSKMPSLFEHFDARNRVIGMIPSLVALLLGVLEKMKLLPSK